MYSCWMQKDSSVMYRLPCVWFREACGILLRAGLMFPFAVYLLLQPYGSSGLQPRSLRLSPMKVMLLPCVSLQQSLCPHRGCSQHINSTPKDKFRIVYYNTTTTTVFAICILCTKFNCSVQMEYILDLQQLPECAFKYRQFCV